MAAVKGTITVPGSTGTQSITASNPKAIILWGTYTDQANGSEAADGFFGIGIGTYRGGTVQQRYACQHDDDATASGTYTTSSNNDALLRLITTANTVDAVVTLDSMSSSEVVLNWTDLPTTGSLILHYLILTDAELSDAFVHEFTAADVDENVTVTTGFGKPNAVLFIHPGLLRAAHGTGRTDMGVGIGVASSSTARYATQFWGDDTAGTIELAHTSGSRASVAMNGVGLKTFEMDFTADSGGGAWPTDGFRVTYPDTASGLILMCLSMKLADGAALTVGSTSTLTSGGPQDLAHSTAPTCAFLFGGLDATGNGLQSAETGGIWASGWDGTNEGGAGQLSDHGTGNSQAGRWSRNDKTITVYELPGSATTAPTADAQADGSASGSNLRLSYTTFSSTARAFGYLLISGAAGAGSNALAGAINAQSNAAGALTVTATLVGAVAAQSSVTGSLTVTAGLTGAVGAQSSVTGALTVTAGLAGTVAATSTVAGTLTVTAGLAGAVDAQSNLSGSLTNTPPGTVALVGSIAAQSSVTGNLTSSVPLAGAAAAQSSTTGNLTVRAVLIGAVGAQSNLAGHITVGKPLASMIAAQSSVTATLTNQGPVVTVARLEGGLSARVSEDGETSSISESTSGLQALIE